MNTSLSSSYIYKIIIVGAGHAGLEAAHICAKLGIKTLLITQNIETIGVMSCNPSIGGIGKSHLVREIDALGGLMGICADLSAIQIRTLNQKKGPAVRATRAQIDRNLYRLNLRKKIENQANLNIFQQSVEKLIIENGKIKGLITASNIRFYADNVIITAGTFLNGLIHIGKNTKKAGRDGDPASLYLSDQLKETHQILRLKTGTPARIKKQSIDFSNLEIQASEYPLKNFSFIHDILGVNHPNQIDCYITYTNEKTHQIINDNIHLSAMYSGQIKSIGPRYCPSIEDKLTKFPDKNRHQIFLEPEGIDSTEIYPNGLSTSLPFDIQLQYIQSIKGLENAVLTRAGYAIEYDCFNPKNLKHTLESSLIQGLFLAGQVNGTTGYEEAAAQGILAGINAALKVLEKDSWYPKRSQAYLGVMVDDLINFGVNEPYRMFTSRSEYRLILRQDNADLRLTPIAIQLGLVSDQRKEIFEKRQKDLTKNINRLKNKYPSEQKYEQVIGTKLSNKNNSLFDLLKRNDLNYQNIKALDTEPIEDENLIKQIEIQATYSGYIQRQQKEIERKEKNNDLKIPTELDFNKLSGLSTEMKQKLNQSKPKTIAQASQISGITPAAVSLLIVMIKSKELKGFKGKPKVAC